MSNRGYTLLGLLAGLGTAISVAAHGDSVRPFTIAIKETVLTDLRERIDRTRWPQQIEGSGWEYGPDARWMRGLVDEWTSDYDWRAVEARLNEFPQFKTEIDGLDLHFLHVKSSSRDALPLVLIHGWPGSFAAFTKLIPLLTEPERHGGDPGDAFHVVVPSLPGFGFSELPAERGWNSVRMAEVLAKLMRKLGYDRYGAQGGDWGGGMVRWLAANDGAHCVGAHSNFPPARPPREDPMRGVTEEEIERYRSRRSELADHKGYSSIQGTRPLALGYGLRGLPKTSGSRERSSGGQGADR